MRVKLQAIKQELRRSMHQPIPQQGRWLQQVVTSYFNYHAVPTNRPTLTAFLFHVTNLWRRTLQWRSQKDWTTWERTKRQIAPSLTRVAILRDPAIAAGIGQFAAIQSVARNSIRRL
jgi:hypothetical protein